MPYRIAVTVVMPVELKAKLDELKRKGKIDTISGFVEQAIREKLEREGLT